MSDATVLALTTTVQNEIAAGAALPADIIALSVGIVNGATTYAATTLARRVGLITDINILGGEDIGKEAMKYNECQSSLAFARSSISANSDLGQLRAAIPGLSTAQMNFIATGVMTRAAAYQTEFNQTLPS